MSHTPLPRRALLAGAALLASPAVLRAQTPVLRVANQRGGLRSLLEASGLASDLPFRIEWYEFPAAQPLLEALNAYAIDVGSMGDLNFFNVFSSGAPIKAISATRSDGASQAVVARPGAGIADAAGLRGKRIAAARGGWTHYSLLRILEKQGLAPGDVSIAWLLPADAALALRSGAVDAWSVWEPFTSLEILEFQASLVADARGLTPSASFLAAHDHALRDKAPLLKELSDRVARGWDWARGNIPDYARATATLLRQPVPVLERAYRVNDTRAIPIDEAAIAEWQEAADKAQGFGVIPRPLKVAEAIHRL
ncbi:ABC transporter substrate-binding protein [Pseudoroseomonas cervicalis]|uniref:ABC transporter substrate-binding protein n=1 Tax=Teichococcus cervicalis TaxID=204525 RepID=UPI002785B518|nr:ABC transporter substrate-binding protein [Pseudoroseomonas cervicalis]MDQ1081693.1 sulfonate transport system substrate-binding protein [Pseudoroseomonas cervicalis]